jgi:predicted RNase H-like nuclease (RuvC/YqgF family)
MMETSNRKIEQSHKSHLLIKLTIINAHTMNKSTSTQETKLTFQQSMEKRLADVEREKQALTKQIQDLKHKNTRLESEKQDLKQNNTLLGLRKARNCRGECVPC